MARFSPLEMGNACSIHAQFASTALSLRRESKNLIINEGRGREEEEKGRGGKSFPRRQSVAVIVVFFLPPFLCVVWEKCISVSHTITYSVSVARARVRADEAQHKNFVGQY